MHFFLPVLNKLMEDYEETKTVSQFFFYLGEFKNFFSIFKRNDIDSYVLLSKP